MTPEDMNEEEIIYVSKSELKRDAQALRDLGKTLTELKQSLWPELPITDTLLAALHENNKLSSHEAKRRHLQFIGKTLKHEDLDAIHQFLALQDPSSQEYGRLQKQQEQWRLRLVNETDALQEFIDAYPEVDRQQLRNLVRNAQKDLAAAPDKSSTAFKKLFQFIREVTKEQF